MEILDAYIRVSRRGERRGPAYISIPVQRDRIHGWASARGVQIGKEFIDEDKSGGSPSRPGLDVAVARAEAGVTSGIVSAQIDRFSRLTEQGLRDLRRLQAVGARLVFVREDIDFGGPTGKFMYVLWLAQAELFLDQIKAAWIEAKTRAIARGAHIGRTPLGYTRDEDGTLEPSKDAEHVSEAYRLAAAGNLPQAGIYLTRHFPEREWTSDKVRRMLASRTYLGEVRYGPDMAQPDAHIPLVTRPVWEAAQSSPAARRPNETFPLSGILSCGRCGQRMVGGRGGKGQRTYRCAQSLSTARGEKCAGAAVITASIVEEHVRDEAERLLEGWRAVVADPESDRLALLERNVMDARAELDAFAADLTLRRALGGSYHQHLAARVEAVEAAEGAYRQAARQAAPVLPLTAGEILADDVTLAGWLRGMFVVSVLPGRGRVQERVVFRALDDDGLAGVAGLEGGE